MTTLRFSLSKFSLSNVLLLVLLAAFGLLGGAKAQTTTAFGVGAVPHLSSSINISGEYGFPGAHGGHSVTISPGSDIEINTVFTGTSVALTCNPYSGETMDVTVTPLPGGTPVSSVVTLASTSSQTSWSNVSLASGLAEGTYQLQVKFRAGNSFFWIDSISMLSVTGAAPSVALPAGYGPQYYINNSNSTVSTAAYVLPEGDILVSAGQSSPKTVALNTALHFRAMTSSISLWTYGNSALYKQLVVDGKPLPYLSTYSVMANHSNAYQVIATGLDGTAYHDYVILAGGQSDGNHWCELMFTGTGASLDMTRATKARPVLATFGDSITASFGLPSTPMYDYTAMLGKSLNMAVANRGVSGNKVADLLARITDITGLSPAPKFCIIHIGTNDVAAAGGTITTPSTFLSGYQSLLIQLTQACPSTRFYCLGIMPGFALQYQYSDIIQQAVASAHSPNVFYLDAGYWNPVISAGVHPSAPGYKLLADQLLPSLFDKSLTTRHTRQKGN